MANAIIYYNGAELTTVDSNTIVSLDCTGTVMEDDVAIELPTD